MPSVGIEGLYKCAVCDQVKPDEDFPSDSARRGRKRTPHCKSCHARRRQKWVDANRDVVKKSQKRYSRLLREMVFEALGNVCACCGETEVEFLCIDHVKGDGAEHRKVIASGPMLYVSIRNEGFPKDRYQLLCYNCNNSKGYGPNRQCVHQRLVSDLLNREP